MKKKQIIQDYQKAAESYRLLAEKEGRLLLFLSVIRLVTFIGGLVIIWIGFTAGITTGYVLILLVAALFIFLVRLFWYHSEKRKFIGNLSLINEKESVAVAGDYSVFEQGGSYLDKHHDFSYDVDLFGNGSLFQYLNRTVTGYGRDILAGWLSDPYSLKQEITLRQEAIEELAMKEKWRHNFMASAMETPLEEKNITGLLKWMKEKAGDNSSGFTKLLINILPILAIASLLLLILGIVDYHLFLMIFLLNLLFITIGLKKTNAIHNGLSKKYSYLSMIDKLIRIFNNEAFSAGVLKDIQLNISGTRESATVSVKKLGRLLQAFDSRLNMLVSVVLNGLFLWDYQCINRLEKWKSEYSHHFPEWLKMIGQVDAFISLGNYAFNNRDFVYPVISEGREVFSARDLGHQLIEESRRICNDFSLKARGGICIISGANMAGKSTFLRSVAVNFILGMAGAPVCATEMRFMPVKIFTSMRTTDSLSDNESYFYAELKRLKILKTKIEEGEPVFFILDEILKGTNSADKSLGSKLFLEKVLSLGGTGLIATHDISLGLMENDHPERIFNKCFEVEIDGENITFDYRLQDGITSKMNAAFLMKQMGILE